MKTRFLIVSLLVAMISSSCQAFAPEPTPTITPEPPTATSTPLPTETATPIPTATPNLAATAAFKATQSAGDVAAEIKDLLGDMELDFETGSLLWQQKEPLGVQMSGPESRYQPFAEDVEGKNFIIKSDVTWKATGIIVCGIIFRSEPNLAEGDQYEFLFLRFSGSPAWAIEYHEFGYFSNSPTGVKYSGAVDLDNGATNQIMMVANDNEFTVFINGVRQGRYFDNSSQRMDGDFAVLGLQDSGEGSCEFTNTWVWELK